MYWFENQRHFLLLPVHLDLQRHFVKESLIYLNTCYLYFGSYPGGKFHFAAILSVLKVLIIVPVGTMGSFLLEDNPFKTVKGLVDYV